MLSGTSDKWENFLQQATLGISLWDLSWVENSAFKVHLWSASLRQNSLENSLILPREISRPLASWCVSELQIESAGQFKFKPSHWDLNVDAIQGLNKKNLLIERALAWAFLQVFPFKQCARNETRTGMTNKAFWSSFFNVANNLPWESGSGTFHFSFPSSPRLIPFRYLDLST